MDVNEWDDIGDNFVVGEDGRVYTGRGSLVEGAHAAGWNTRSLGIAIIGDFTSKPIRTVYQHDNL
jgi:N-acetylmuramoyl-L-alanine amidase